MAVTPSSMLALQTTAPDFSLPDTISAKIITLQRIKSDIATVVMFICNHCPYVIHIRDEIVKLANEYIRHDIAFVAISSNDIEQYPEDGPEPMKELADKLSFPFPYLYDESQETAKAYQAACTPDFYVFDNHLKLVYRGQFDDSRPGNNIPVSGKDLRSVLDKIINKKSIPAEQKPSLGCNIKWKV